MRQPTLEELEEFHTEMSQQHPGVTLPAIVALGLNTYHFGINGYEPSQIGELLFRPHQDVGLNRAEVAEDIFENGDLTDIFRGIPTIDFGDAPPGHIQDRIDEIKALALAQGIQIASTGTGAFLYTRMRQAKVGVMDGDEEHVSQAKNVARNYSNIADLLGAPIIGGHRVVTMNPATFARSQMVQLHAGTNGWELPLEVDPTTLISQAEAWNIQTAIELNRHNPAVSGTVELMYQDDGMAPTGIRQWGRMLHIIQANSPPGQRQYAHMDIGHVIVTGVGKSEDDHYLMKYVEGVNWPRWVVHFNSLYRNEHGMPTRENVERDFRARGEPKDDKVPFPAAYCNVYDWLRGVVNQSRIVQLTPEPKDTRDLARLAQEGRGFVTTTTSSLWETHQNVPGLPGYLVPREMTRAFTDKFVTPYLTK